MKLSVIIPTFNEEQELPKLLQFLREYSQLHEIIVVDANSNDNTVAIAEQFGCLVIQSSIKRRSVQLDMGGKIASGDWLFFLHADSIPPNSFINDISSIQSQKASAGCFRLKFDPSNAFLRFFEMFVGIPWLICRGGDQGLVIKNTVYRAIGGFNTALHIMEDIDIIVRLKKNKEHFVILQTRIKTSSRAYEQYGNWRLQWAYALTHLRFWLGVDSEKNLELLNKQLNKNGNT